jgi:glycyl-tRNA synthetase beta chain
MRQFLLEIGTEELPASFQQPAALELERRVRALLDDRGIAAGRSRLFHAPRRIAVRLDDVPTEKPSAVVEVQGPPRRVAFDAEGRPTRTAVGFARAQGAAPEALYTKATPRGEYAFVRKQTEAVPTAAVLGSGLPDLIAALPFPKAMRWTAGRLAFARPVRWLLCLLGTEPVRFSLDGLESGAATMGHRNFTAAPIPVPAPDAYETVLAEHKVTPDHAVRRAAIEAALSRLAAEVSGQPVRDTELLDETTDITEFPELVRCAFRPEYLNLPAEVLITALKKHQRCFSVRNSERAGLLPFFIAVTNTPGCDRGRVGAWYEKAIESRLRDARFFVQADVSRGLEPLVEEEKRVVWIEGMGSYFDKTERLRALCRHLAAGVPQADAAALDRAALLSKADLLTNMVREKEFTSLQGRVGGIYARLLGEPEPVAAAIADHYLPNFAGDRLPASLEAALLSIADKTDNIAAAFLAGATPTGSEDPLALRRQATGLLAIITEQGLAVDTAGLVAAAAGLFPDRNPDLAAQLPGFFRERTASLIADTGIAYDIAAAVLETDWSRPVLALARARALAAFRTRPEFERLIVGQKRVANILKRETAQGRPDPSRLTEPAEQLLWRETRAAEPALSKALDAHEYDTAFSLLLGLRPVIDRFFDDVLVMDKDAEIRTNRLRLLAYTRHLFGLVADLSKIVLEGE